MEIDCIDCGTSWEGAESGHCPKCYPDTTNEQENNLILQLPRKPQKKSVKYFTCNNCEMPKAIKYTIELYADGVMSFISKCSHCRHQYDFDQLKDLKQ